MHKQKIDGSPRHISVPFYETLSKSDKRFLRNAADKFIFKVAEEELSKNNNWRFGRLKYKRATI